MTTIALLYGTTEGHTAKIAQHIAHRGAQAGIRIDLFHAAEVPPDLDLGARDGVILAGSIHEGHYQRYLVSFMKEHKAELAKLPTALVTVCLAIHSANADERAEAEKFPEQLVARAGFRATRSVVVAGALMYTQYSWLKRVVMKQISKHEGGSTDTARDHEYTDWAQVDAFADAFFADVAKAKAR